MEGPPIHQQDANILTAISRDMDIIGPSLSADPDLDKSRVH